MAEAGEERPEVVEGPEPGSEGAPERSPFLACLFAWLCPGAGHLYLKKNSRAIAFFLVVAGFAVLGTILSGKLYLPEAGRPLSYLSSFANLGLGPYYVIVVFGSRVVDSMQFLRSGDPLAVTYEHGTTFLLTAGILNILLMLDAWDIATGRKQ